LKSPEELARPLVYLMGRGDHEQLMSIDDSDSLKAAVDRFWLLNIRNKSDAKTILRLYYERVEEANKRFSNFKEGWKTDRGLVFILFGSPISVQEIHDTETWHYSYNRNNSRYNYEFKKNRFKSEFYPFDYYVLQRDAEYYNLQKQQVNLWLSGQIIYRKL
ncbi:MAG: GWxTD domain-containing protein, partial [Balneolaceae bacterium]|nr:GWxTD domain-containing protein [Balneolaceae bacterium]